jgi:hypothetical protein
MRFSRFVDGSKIDRRYYTGGSLPSASEPPQAGAGNPALGETPLGFKTLPEGARIKGKSIGKWQPGDTIAAERDARAATLVRLLAVADAEVLRTMTKLEKINHKPAPDFWTEAGTFKR